MNEITKEHKRLLWKMADTRDYKPAPKDLPLAIDLVELKLADSFAGPKGSEFFYATSAGLRAINFYRCEGA